MVVVRLALHGAKNKPFYQIVVTNSRNKLSGRFAERLGYYNPIARGKEQPFKINMERLQYWIHCGARCSQRVESLVKMHTKNIEKNNAKA